MKPQLTIRDLFWLVLVCALMCALVSVGGIPGKIIFGATLVAVVAWRRVEKRRERESGLELATRWGDSVIVVTMYASLFVVVAAICGFGALCVYSLRFGLPD